MVTDTEHKRLTSIARRHGAGDDAPDIVQSEIVKFLTLPRPLTEAQATRPFSCLARAVQFGAKNHRNRNRLVTGCQNLDVRVTYADRLEARQKLDAARRALATLSDADRAILTASDLHVNLRMRKSRLVRKLRAMIP